MSIKNKAQVIRKKTRTIKRKVTASVMAFTPIHMLVKNRRAVSSVVSNLILMAAVIVVGFIALGYARSTSNDYVSDYGQSVNADIDKLRETISFEYAFYNATHYGPTNGSLTVYFMNAGSINDVIVKNSTVSNSSWSISLDCTGKTKLLNSTSTNNYDFGQEGYFIQPLNTTLTSNIAYTVKIITGRDSAFVYNFSP
ncbi:MAG: hypothetical protein M1167_05570 [Chloroflexi bacterium]|nr:hypothetical protein [Chloroflexota bacterium]MCL5949506.1 hypothetical protein [Candidatus Bathyarchaeota archaeon]